MSNEEPPEDGRSSGNMAVLIAVVVLLAVGWLVMHFYMQNQAMETCRLEGRRDCDPITVPNQ